MASAARLVLATSSAASSTVRPWSWLMTDITMFIITWSRRSLRRSSSCSCCSLLAGFGPASLLRSDSPIEFPQKTSPKRLQPWAAFALLAARLQFRCPAQRYCCARRLWAASYTETLVLQPTYVNPLQTATKHPGPPPSPVFGLGGVVSCPLHRIHGRKYGRGGRGTRGSGQGLRYRRGIGGDGGARFVGVGGNRCHHPEPRGATGHSARRGRSRGAGSGRPGRRRLADHRGLPQ